MFKIAYKRLKSDININGKILLALSLFYAYIPLILFFLTWLKLWIGSIAVLVSIMLGMKVYSDFQVNCRCMKMKLSSFISIVLIVILLEIIVGGGGYFPQTDDWEKHNAVLNDLVKCSWPVYYNKAPNPSMLTYYIGQYIVPAAIGKLFARTFRIAEIAILWWTVIGLLLIVFNLFMIFNAQTAKKQFAALIMFILFDGCLLIAQRIFGLFTGVESMSTRWMTQVGDSMLQYKSTVTCLMWVMPQSIVCWLIITLWWNNRNKVNDYVGLMIPSMITGAISFVGLSFMAFICAFIEMSKMKNIKIAFKSILSVHNIVGTIIVGGILLLYYAGNVFSSKPYGIAFRFYKPNALLYVCFTSIEFGLYCFLVSKEEHSNGIFIGATILLLVLPFMRMGQYNDIVISANIPGMFAIMISVVKYVLSHSSDTKKGILIMLIAISAINPIKEIRSPIYHFNLFKLQHNVSSKSLEAWSDFNIVHDDLKYNYFTYDVKNNIFIKYFARNDWQE